MTTSKLQESFDSWVAFKERTNPDAGPMPEELRGLLAETFAAGALTGAALRTTGPMQELLDATQQLDHMSGKETMQ